MAKQTTSTPIDTDTPPPQVKQRGRRIMADPVLAQGLEEDPLLKWLFANYHYFLYAILAVVAANYIVNTFRASKESEMRQAADAFSTVREEFDRYSALQLTVSGLKAKPDASKEGSEDAKSLAKSEGELKQVKDKLNESLNALGDSAPPYDSLAKLYRGLSLIVAGEAVSARQALSDVGDWKALSEGAEQRFFAEHAAAALARALVDQEKSYAEGRTMLKELAERGSFANVSAAITLANISVTPEEKKEALGALEKLKNLHPEQASLVKAEIEMLAQ